MKSLKVFQRVTLCVSSKVIHKAWKTVVLCSLFLVRNRKYVVWGLQMHCLLASVQKGVEKVMNFSGVHVCVWCACVFDLAAAIHANCATHNELSYHILFIQTWTIPCVLSCCCLFSITQLINAKLIHAKVALLIIAL